MILLKVDIIGHDNLTIVEMATRFWGFSKASKMPILFLILGTAREHILTSFTKNY